MNAEERQHLNDLLQANQRRLRILEIKKATFGPRTPPEFETEIEDVQNEIARINSELTANLSLSKPSITADTYKTAEGTLPLRTNTTIKTSGTHQNAASHDSTFVSLPNKQKRPVVTPPRSIVVVSIIILVFIFIWIGVNKIRLGIIAPPGIETPIANNPKPSAAVSEAIMVPVAEHPPLIGNMATTSLPQATSVPSIEPINISSPTAINALMGKIAFVSNRSGNYEIYEMNADGTDPENLTKNLANDDSPAWSPDGTMIAFVSKRDNDDDKKIYVMNADGTNVRRITNYPGKAGVPSWSPDGQSIAYQSLENNDFEIYVVNVNTGTRRKLLDDPSRADLFPAWSPNGAKIAFVAPDENGRLQIYVVLADGSGTPSNLTNNSVCNSGPAWSPDGKYIAFVSYFNTPACPNTSPKIYMISVNQSAPATRLTDSEQDEGIPSWAPDGGFIAFQTGSDDNRMIIIINLNTRQTRTLVRDNSYWPAWSPPLR